MRLAYGMAFGALAVLGACSSGAPVGSVNESLLLSVAQTCAAASGVPNAKFKVAHYPNGAVQKLGFEDGQGIPQSVEVEILSCVQDKVEGR